MTSTREDYIKKLTPHIEEVYELHIKSLDIKRKELENKVSDLKRKIDQAGKRKDSMIHNIGRATNEDLKSYHYLFFDYEGRIKQGGGYE